MGLGIKPVFDELAVTVSVWDSLALPLVMPVRPTVCAPESSFATTLLIAAIVGASFAPMTVTVNVRVTKLLTDWLSLTVTVIVAVPTAFATGVKFKLPELFGLL